MKPERETRPVTEHDEADRTAISVRIRGRNDGGHRLHRKSADTRQRFFQDRRFLEELSLIPDVLELAPSADLIHRTGRRHPIRRGDQHFADRRLLKSLVLHAIRDRDRLPWNRPSD